MEDRLLSVGDLFELLLEGWCIERMHYADRGPAGGPPAAYFDLARGDERQRLHVPDDGRALSHRALVALFRESPHVWKHRSPEMIPPPPPVDDGEWGETAESFPRRSAFRPSGLRRVVAVNQVQSVEDLHIALIALECHDGSARLHFSAHAADPRARGQLTLLDVVVVDDLGRRYRVVVGDARPEGNHLVGSLAIAPGIPVDVRNLTVTVGTVAEGGAGGDALRALGPWIFPISL